MKTLQQIFDEGLNHIRTQGRASHDEDGACMYRAPNGDKCIVGGLIPDNAYDPVFDEQGDGTTVWMHLRPESLTRNRFEAALKAAGIEGNAALDLLCDMQRAHDSFSGSGDFLTRFEARMQALAELRGLIYNPPGAPA
jgi:hypothetical protein